jgi:hypothetical protein
MITSPLTLAFISGTIRGDMINGRTAFEVPIAFAIGVKTVLHLP